VVALQLRIEQAQELLHTTDLPQRDIAEYYGFADVHHFSKAFKRIMRLPRAPTGRPAAACGNDGIPRLEGARCAGV
jgi:transcriptional regulator GlxA family with amidase domain